MNPQACCVLIPSLSPDHRLEEYADAVYEPVMRDYCFSTFREQFPDW